MPKTGALTEEDWAEILKRQPEIDAPIIAENRAFWMTQKARDLRIDPPDDMTDEEKALIKQQLLRIPEETPPAEDQELDRQRTASDDADDAEWHRREQALAFDSNRHQRRSQPTS